MRNPLRSKKKKEQTILELHGIKKKSKSDYRNIFKNPLERFILCPKNELSFMELQSKQSYFTFSIPATKPEKV